MGTKPTWEVWDTDDDPTGEAPDFEDASTAEEAATAFVRHAELDGADYRDTRTIAVQPCGRQPDRPIRRFTVAAVTVRQHHVVEEVPRG